MHEVTYLVLVESFDITFMLSCIYITEDKNEEVNFAWE